ncbi:hypothetical protein [Hymenobacter sp. HDW8]|uniref:hypothetical protein n=1 Tax=Hymenobacter sp. HDW8 TaxID=2714932 RepID=UPI00140D4291|nr:hypothetical protein [Hymenobacter sp. HDW8]QIL78395.1 hypothetical protein G7064_21475 [Hymenobacter sp. HDW8]
MRTFLILGALFFFLHSSWAPSWGQHLANWGLVLVALGFLGGMASKSKIRYQRNRYYDNDFYDQQHR